MRTALSQQRQLLPGAKARPLGRGPGVTGQSAPRGSVTWPPAPQGFPPSALRLRPTRRRAVGTTPSKNLSREQPRQPVFSSVRRCLAPHSGPGVCESRRLRCGVLEAPARTGQGRRREGALPGRASPPGQQCAAGLPWLLVASARPRGPRGPGCALPRAGRGDRVNRRQWGTSGPVISRLVRVFVTT